MAHGINSDAQRQLDLWNTWKQDPGDHTLNPLMAEFERDVDFRVSEFAKQAPVPEAALRSKARQLVLKGLQTYDPAHEANANLRTWVTWQLKKVRSFAIENQNFGRIPEGRALRIGEFLEVKHDLTERLGHPPDAVQLSESLQQFNPRYNWSLAEINRMERELRKDKIESMSLEADTLPTLIESKERDILRYIYYDLTPQERLVYEYTLGVNGKQKLPAKDIARIMRISGPKVSRLRKKIDDKMRARGLL